MGLCKGDQFPRIGEKHPIQMSKIQLRSVCRCFQAAGRCSETFKLPPVFVLIRIYLTQQKHLTKIKQEVFVITLMWLDL